MATPQQIVDLLNEIHALDPECLPRLIEARLPCNEAIANHPTVTVDVPGSNQFTVGLLGIIEGIVGIDGALVGAINDDKTGKLAGFRLMRFEECTREPVTYVPPQTESGA